MYTLPLDIQSQLTTLYSQSHRHYHNLNHINECLGVFETANEEFKFNSTDQYIGVISISFHDAVYNPYSLLNEVASAKLAEHYLDKTDRYKTQTINSIILSTARHVVDQQFMNEDESTIKKVILDIDLFSLGHPWERYVENGKNIRKEFSYVPNGLFLTNRLNFLKTLNKRSSFYYTDYFKNKCHEVSKENVLRDINAIEKSEFIYDRYLRLIG